MNTPEFTEFREKGLCGSDMAAIAGIKLHNKTWKTPLDVYNRIVNHKSDSIPDNPRMKMGRRLEPLILDSYQDEKNVILKRNLRCIHKHPELHFMRGNLDALTPDGKIVVEAKSIDWKKDWCNGDTTKIPAFYLCQIAHYMNITNAEKAHVALLISASDFQIITYDRNEKIQKLLHEKALNFWYEHIVPKIPPPPTTVSDIENYVKVQPNSTVYIDPKHQKLLTELKSIQHYEGKIKESKDAIKLFMHDKENLLDKEENILASYKQNKVRRVDSARLKKEGLYDAFTTESTCRRLLIK